MELKEVRERETTLRGEIRQLLLALDIIAVNDSEFAAEIQPVKDLFAKYQKELVKSEESGIYPEPEAPEPEKPTTLAEIVQEITASMEGEFSAGDVRKLLLEREPELHSKSHAASITTALARLAKDGGTLERISGDGRGKRTIFRRKGKVMP
ncbi:MAG TPA: hypothetical protein VF173_22225 [Thermoanaerobaculia bacterium]|nr:hypothetical protein [Thermoanaerobaculia bacterium]